MHDTCPRAFRRLEPARSTGSRLGVLPGVSVRLWLAAAMAAGCMLHVSQAFASDAAPLAWFAGTWTCTGHFESNGKPIAARLRFEWNEAAGALVKYHDDRPPNAYHAVELWGADGPRGMAATILDPFGGARRFTSAGWADESLTWTRLADAKPVERFLYVREAQDRLRVEWATSRDGSTFKPGDTLLCEREVAG